MSDIQQILREGKERRASKKKRRDVIDSFRKSAERSVGSAAVFFILGVSQGISAFFFVPTRKEGDVWGILQTVLMAGLTCYWFGMCLRKLWVSPRDKLLMIMLDELLAKEEPNQC